MNRLTIKAVNQSFAFHYNTVISFEINKCEKKCGFTISGDGTIKANLHLLGDTIDFLKYETSNHILIIELPILNSINFLKSQVCFSFSYEPENIISTIKKM